MKWANYAFLETEASKVKFKLFLLNFLARIATSNYVDTIAAHALTSLGRQETREKQNRFHTRESSEEFPPWWPPRLTDTAESDQDPILAISEAAGNALVLSPSRMAEGTQATKKETARKRMNQTLFSGRDVVLRGHVRQRDDPFLHVSAVLVDFKAAYIIEYFRDRYLVGDASGLSSMGSLNRMECGGRSTAALTQQISR